MEGCQPSSQTELAPSAPPSPSSNEPSTLLASRFLGPPRPWPLPSSLPPFLPPFLPTFLPPFLPPSLPSSLPPSLSRFLPVLPLPFPFSTHPFSFYSSLTLSLDRNPLQYLLPTPLPRLPPRCARRTHPMLCSWTLLAGPEHREEVMLDGAYQVKP
eukprot:372397-Rhodomonas_salina.1